MAEDGLTIENREIAGLEWRDHPTRVFHPEKQLRASRPACWIDPYCRPRGKGKEVALGPTWLLLVKTAGRRHRPCDYHSQNE